MLDFIRQELVAWDPEHLISEGMPPDEYDSEAAQILKLITADKSVEEIQQIIQAVFDEFCNNSMASAQLDEDETEYLPSEFYDILTPYLTDPQLNKECLEIATRIHNHLH